MKWLLEKSKFTLVISKMDEKTMSTTKSGSIILGINGDRLLETYANIAVIVT